jgi:hypothetical protein
MSEIYDIYSNDRQHVLIVFGKRKFGSNVAVLELTPYFLRGKIKNGIFRLHFIR